jgi:3',5'-nucleoside bisphosphate phosphatase
VIEAARDTGLTVLPGMELQTREEVHLLCLFETPEQAEAWQGEVYRRLPALLNPEDHLGPQFVVDAAGDYVETEGRLLLTSADIGLEEAVTGVQRLGGWAIPAHVDRPAFSLLANLGMVPPGLPVAAMELFRHSDPVRAVAQYPELGRYSLVSGGDAHQLDEMSNRTRFKVEGATFDEVRLALANRDGRKVTVD